MCIDKPIFVFTSCLPIGHGIWWPDSLLLLTAVVTIYGQCRVAGINSIAVHVDIRHE